MPKLDRIVSDIQRTTQRETIDGILMDLDAIAKRADRVAEGARVTSHSELTEAIQGLKAVIGTIQSNLEASIDRIQADLMRDRDSMQSLAERIESVADQAAALVGTIGGALNDSLGKTIDEKIGAIPAPLVTIAEPDLLPILKAIASIKIPKPADQKPVLDALAKLHEMLAGEVVFDIEREGFSDKIKRIRARRK